jgi:16S rRNA pseudouridine516 synthase
MDVMNIRIDKYLADMGMGSRTEIKNDIKKGLVFLNGNKVKSSNDKVDTSKDIVMYKGEEIKYYEYEYFLLNKPAGVISATEDNRSKTVLDLITDCNRKDLFPVGRLDKDTEGLLLITNDGALAHELLSPKKHVDKTYYVETDARLTEEHVKMFREGIEVDEDFVAMSATLVIQEAEDTGSKALLTIREGKFHQVKRMMEAVGNTVTYLKRISMGPLKLPEDLNIGEYRRLSEEEINMLKGN